MFATLRVVLIIPSIGFRAIMEYEFIHDPTNGASSAKFSLEHENLGPWLEIELGSDTEKLTELLTAIAAVESGKQHEVNVIGQEFSVMIDKNDVIIQSNIALNGDDENIPDGLENSEQFAMSSCGLDDFRQLLLSWSKFTL